MLHLADVHAALDPFVLTISGPVALLLPLGVLLVPSTGNAATDIVGVIAQFGLFGAVVLDALLTRKLLIPRGTYDEALRQRDQRILERDANITELKAALIALQNMTREEMLPALIKANEIQAQYISILTDEHRRR